MVAEEVGDGVGSDAAVVKPRPLVIIIELEMLDAIRIELESIGIDISDVLFEVLMRV